MVDPAKVQISLSSGCLNPISTSCIISKVCRLLKQPNIHIFSLKFNRPCCDSAREHRHALSALHLILEWQTPSGRLSKFAYMQTNTEAAYKIQLEFLGEDRHGDKARIRGSGNSTCSHPIMISSFFSASLEPEYSSGASSAHDGSIERRDG